VGGGGVWEKPPPPPPCLATPVAFGEATSKLNVCIRGVRCSVLQCVAACCGATSRLCMCTCEVSFGIFVLPDNLAAPTRDGGDGGDEMAVWGSDYTVVSTASVAAIYRVSCSHI